jgi:hypothetical protein
VWEAIQSQVTIIPKGVGFTIKGMVHKTDAAHVANTYAFHGFATLPATPTPAAPITDGYGWEEPLGGGLYAVIYQSGTRVFNQAVTRPSDGNFHRYLLTIRSDLVVWYIDSIEVPVMTASFVTPTYESLPVCQLLVNNSVAPVSGPTFITMAIGIGDSAANTKGISDGLYPWRQATVKAASTAAAATDLPLVVALHPTSPMPMQPDSLPATQNITAQDTGGSTVVTAVGYGQSIVTGTAAAGSTASFTFSTEETVRIQVTGSWSGTLQLEKSMDGGTTWVTTSGHVSGTGAFASTFTQNFIASVNCAGQTQLRVRSTATWTWTATVKVIVTANVQIVYDQAVNVPKASTSAVTQVASSATVVTLLAANNARMGAIITNNSTQVLYVKLGSGASTTSYSVVVPISNGEFEIPYGYTGIITGIWASANGYAYCTELTA